MQHQQLWSVIVAVTLAFGASAALPYGHSIIAPPTLLGVAVPDEAADDRTRVAVAVTSKLTQHLPIPPDHRSATQSVSTDELHAVATSRLHQVHGARQHASSLVPAPLRC